MFYAKKRTFRENLGTVDVFNIFASVEMEHLVSHKKQCYRAGRGRGAWVPSLFW